MAERAEVGITQKEEEEEANEEHYKKKRYAYNEKDPLPPRINFTKCNVRKEYNSRWNTKYDPSNISKIVNEGECTNGK